MFNHSFQSFFGDRVRRDEAVSKWNKLTQTAGIDAFLDKIVQLMWKTGYSSEVVDDKISQGLNMELALDWAKVAVKPDTLHERIQLIHHMGNILERHSKMKPPPVSAETEKNGGEKKSTKQKRQKAPADTEKKEAGSNQTSTEKKDKAVELKDMSEYMLAY